MRLLWTQMIRQIPGKDSVRLSLISGMLWGRVEYSSNEAEGKAPKQELEFDSREWNRVNQQTRTQLTDLIRTY